MAQEACSNFWGVYRKFKPHLLMVLAQVAFTFLYFLTEASFNHGMNPHVYITYRHVVSGLVMFPFAYVLERLEVLDLRSPRGLEKVLGTLVSLAGVMTMTLFKGPMAITLKRYPAQLSLTTWMGFIGAAQSAVFTLCIEHRRAAWAIGFNIDLWSILYSGAVCSGLKIFVQLWCTEKKGPVFVAMFDPVSTVFVALLAYFVLGERLYTGS
ncbi:PREDICTED: WAT1-related [Prunus dulcis]|uniref:WAT1-related protein n=1 Tax=Prunus dulcis TaxID=3755 RepID=A0A5E4ELW5_PRUDU|nr:PREDICTED: WAT1-related [Prunus dulcis]